VQKLFLFVTYISLLFFFLFACISRNCSSTNLWYLCWWFPGLIWVLRGSTNHSSRQKKAKITIKHIFQFKTSRCTHRSHYHWHFIFHESAGTTTNYKAAQGTLQKKKEHLVDLIIKHADPEFLEPYIATARQKFDEKNKKNLAEINRTRLQEWRQKKRKHDSQSVHVNRVLGQQKRRARETDKKVTIQAQLMECLKRHDPNDPIHNQPMAEHNMRAFDKEKSLLKVNICPLCKQGRILKL